MTIYLDSFSGKAADLKRKDRTELNVLRCLSESPRLSVWDLSELAWLRNIVGGLRRSGMIVDVDEPFPWHRFQLTEKGRAALRHDQ